MRCKGDDQSRDDPRTSENARTSFSPQAKEQRDERRSKTSGGEKNAEWSLRAEIFSANNGVRGHAAEHCENIVAGPLLIPHAGRYEERHYGQSLNHPLDIFLVTDKETKSKIESDNVVQLSDGVEESLLLSPQQCEGKDIDHCIPDHAHIGGI